MFVNINNVSLVECSPIDIQPKELVKLIKTPVSTSVIYDRNSNNSNSSVKPITAIHRLSKNYYCNSDGDVFEYKHYTKRINNPSNLRKSLDRCKNLIYCNFESFDTIFITLTYKNQIQNLCQVSSDMVKFIKKLRYHHHINKYLYTLELQSNGNWHIHLLINKVDGISNKKIKNYWSKGRIKAELCTSIFELGKYLTDFSLYEPLVKLDISDSNKGPKKYRVNEYPPNFKLYRHSRGLTEPLIYYVTYEDALSYTQNQKLDFRKDIEVVKDGKKVNSIRKETFQILLNSS